MAPIQRKLAAILAADVYQFSKLMGEDEAGTLADLRACRQLVDFIISEHHGRIFGSADDSVIVEFASAVSAVLCAVECQRAIAARNAQSATRPLQFRIGVNIGDVIIEGDNLYGDGVNVAARLESVASPGSICVSAKVALSRWQSSPPNSDRFASWRCSISNDLAGSGGGQKWLTGANVTMPTGQVLAGPKAGLHAGCTWRPRRPRARGRQRSDGRRPRCTGSPHPRLCCA